MKKIFYFFLILVQLSNVAFAQDEEEVQSTGIVVNEKNLDVAIGIDEIIKFDYKFNTKIQIGNEKLLNLIISPAKQEITFKGREQGKTSVTVRDQGGEIRDKFIVNITSDGNSNIVKELRDLIGDIEGIEIGIKGNKVYVGGEIVVPSDIGRLSTVLEKYPDTLVLVELSDQTQRVIARKIQDELSRNNLRDVSVRVVNKTFWLEGVVNASSKKDLAMEIANAYLPDRIKTLAATNSNGRIEAVKRDSILNFISVNEQKDPPAPQKLLKISTQFVELSKNYNNSFGFRWAPFMNNEGSISFGQTNQGEISTSQDGTLAGTITNLLPKLNSAKSAGYARIIQSAMIVTEDKQTGNVSKTTQYSYAVGTGENQQAQTVNLTFDFKVTPEVVADEAVKMDVGVNISTQAGQSEAGTPQTTSNNVTTKVVVKSKESAVIGGIVQNSSSTDYDKGRPSLQTDGNKDATALFDLYRAKSYGTNKSQFVIFVTPEIIQSASEGTEEIRQKFKKRNR